MRAGDVHSITVKDNDLACQQADNARDNPDDEEIPYIPLTEEEAEQMAKELADRSKEVDRMLNKMYARAARLS